MTGYITLQHNSAINNEFEVLSLLIVLQNIEAALYSLFRNSDLILISILKSMCIRRRIVLFFINQMHCVWK